MTDAGPKTFDPHPRRAETLEHALAGLDRAGVRLAFPEGLHTTQVRWPDDCPLTEDQLRTELRALVTAAEAVARRARELHERLPEPAEFEQPDLDVVPESL